MIVDEVQTGMGRSGQLLAHHYSLPPFSKKSPDLIILAKSLSNGFYPVSCVLGNSNIIDLIRPGEHGSTFSGNPVGMQVAYYCLKELTKNNNQIVNNAFKVGGFLSLLIYHMNSKFIKEIRGRGLMIGVEFKHDIPIDASDICLLLMERGMISKPTHKYNIRIAPPLNVTLEEAAMIYEIMKFVLKGLEKQYPNYNNNEKTKANLAVNDQHKQAVMDYIDLREKTGIKYSSENVHQKRYMKKIFSENSLNDLIGDIDLSLIEEKMNFDSSLYEESNPEINFNRHEDDSLEPIEEIIDIKDKEESTIPFSLMEQETNSNKKNHKYENFSDEEELKKKNKKSVFDQINNSLNH